MGDIVFIWMSKKQPIVTLSTCEAEYVAATSCVCHAIWLRNLLKEIVLIQEEPTKVCVDNKSAIALAKNPVFHDRSKHIDIHYHYIRECITRKDVQIEYVKVTRSSRRYFYQATYKRRLHKIKELTWGHQIKFKGGCWIINLIHTKSDPTHFLGCLEASEISLVSK